MAVCQCNYGPLLGVLETNTDDKGISLERDLGPLTLFDFGRLVDSGFRVRQRKSG